MGAKQRFFIGGLGALMPVLVSLLAIDIGAMLDKGGSLTTGNIVGFIIRYLILFGIGGFVAYLHNDERKPFKLFELGIAAPALLTSLITAQGLSTPEPPAETHAEPSASWGISFIRSAHAADVTEQPEQPVMLASGFLHDIFRGASGSVYREINAPVQKTRQRDESAPGALVTEEGRVLSEPDRSEAELRPVPALKPAQKQQALTAKSPAIVTPKAKLLAVPPAASNRAMNQLSASKPTPRSVEELRSRAIVLKARLMKTEQELRQVERALARAQVSDQ